ncbi:hypothetical protein [Maritimibacter dapengensis]|uniref:Uncharacterized protein n=1 Tax=Maritimibacter dapengensis TaxID=2836868 RepID=A0ABS6T4I9_9RHOB|nr:hypothetical protein [Maritimibacter dapengensis]MBV7379466.1 hypothetical protein [Maritimibacter dapengensis]
MPLHLRNWAYFNSGLAFANRSTVVVAEVLVTHTIATPETEFLRTRFQIA